MTWKIYASAPKTSPANYHHADVIVAEYERAHDACAAMQALYNDGDKTVYVAGHDTPCLGDLRAH